MELMKEFSKVTTYKVNDKKAIMFIFTNNE